MIAVYTPLIMRNGSGNQIWCVASRTRGNLQKLQHPYVPREVRCRIRHGSPPRHSILCSIYRKVGAALSPQASLRRRGFAPGMEISRSNWYYISCAMRHPNAREPTALKGGGQRSRPPKVGWIGLYLVRNKQKFYVLYNFMLVHCRCTRSLVWFNRCLIS